MSLVYLNVEEEYLDSLGYEKQEPTNQYEKARYKQNGLTLILYTSKKLVVQGSEGMLELFDSDFQLEKKESKQKKQVVVEIPELAESIGSDETLKGDTFGGLVVAGAYFKKRDEETLLSLGVTDSKKLTDKQIVMIAEKLLELYPNNFSIKELMPKDYNDLESEQSLTKILNDLHILVGADLKKKFPEAKQVVDKYPGCAAGDYMIEKAESWFLTVAAASIVARYRGIKQFDDLSEKAGMLLPKGSTHVSEVLEKVKERGLPLADFAKLHFKNVKY